MLVGLTKLSFSSSMFAHYLLGLIVHMPGVLVVELVRLLVIELFSVDEHFILVRPPSHLADPLADWFIHMRLIPGRHSSFHYGSLSSWPPGSVRPFLLLCRGVKRAVTPQLLVLLQVLLLGWILDHLLLVRLDWDWSSLPVVQKPVFFVVREALQVHQASPTDQCP